MSIPSTPEELGRELNSIRTQLNESENKREVVEKALETLKGSMQSMQEQRFAAAAAQTVSGPDRELRAYAHVENEVTKKNVAQNRGAFIVGAGEALQIREARNGDGSTTYGLLDDPNPRHEWQQNLQRAVTKRSLIRSWLAAKAHREGTEVSTPNCDAELQAALRSAPDSVVRIFADNANTGAEWIPDNYLPQLERELELTSRLSALFDVINVPPGGDFKMPFLTTGLRPYIKQKATSDDPAKYAASTLGTDQRTKSVKDLAVRLQVDENALEDSYIAAFDVGRQEILRALIDGREDVVLNGDTAASHQDTLNTWNIRSRWGAAGLGSSDDHRRHSIGLRARAFDISGSAGVTDLTATQTAAGVRSIRAKMHAAHAMGRLVYVTSPEFFLTKMLDWEETKTWDKVGAAASVLTGMIGNPTTIENSVGTLDGIPIIISWFFSADLATSGLYTGTGAKTGLVAVNLDRFKMFIRRGAMLRTAVNITNGTVDAVATDRWLFDTFDSADVENVHYAYNLG